MSWKLEKTDLQLHTILVLFLANLELSVSVWPRKKNIFIANLFASDGSFKAIKHEIETPGREVKQFYHVSLNKLKFFLNFTSFLTINHSTQNLYD